MVRWRVPGGWDMGCEISKGNQDSLPDCGLEGVKNAVAIT